MGTNQESESEENRSENQTRRLARLGISVAGGAIAVLGMILSVFMYFTVVNAVNSAQGILDAQLLATSNVLDNTGVAMDQAALTLAGLAAYSSSTADSFASVSTALSSAGTSMDGIADTLDSYRPLISVDTAKLRESAGDFRAASGDVRATATAAGQVSTGLQSLEGKVTTLRAALQQSKNDIQLARQTLGVTFNSLRFSALLLSLAFFLVFLILGIYAIALQL